MITPGFRRDFDAARDPATARNALGIVDPTTWTPTLTFVTPGDLSVAYTTRVGTCSKHGRLVCVSFNVVTSSFTHSTASGGVRITGLPFTSGNTTGRQYYGALFFNGITKATYTQFTAIIQPNVAYVEFWASGTAVTVSQVTAANMPTGGTVILSSTIAYEA